MLQKLATPSVSKVYQQYLVYVPRNSIVHGSARSIPCISSPVPGFSRTGIGSGYQGLEGVGRRWGLSPSPIQAPNLMLLLNMTVIRNKAKNFLSLSTTAWCSCPNVFVTDLISRTRWACT